MRNKKINATRMQLALLKKRLKIAVRGFKLLKDKQDAMVQRFMRYIRENELLRKKLDTEIKLVAKEFIKAKIKSSDIVVTEALSIPSKVLEAEVRTRSVMNVSIPRIKLKQSEFSKVSYGLSFTSVSFDKAVKTLVAISQELLRLAEIEKACLSLSKEIEKTRRRVNAIEFVMVPEMKKQIKEITNKLEDNERSNIIRLMKSKEIIMQN